MCDKLVFDLAQEVEGSPSVFVRKDWINILDNQTQNYTSNQSVLDTSQLSNSNKYMSYRESYFLLPFNVTMATLTGAITSAALPGGISDAMAQEALKEFRPTNIDYAVDSVIGLKNWFGNIIHSFTLDYNGSTIIQQTPFVNMWNSFKLMTSMSYNDVITQGCTIGFYPDNAESVAYYNSSIANANDPTRNYIAQNIQYAQPFSSYVSIVEGNGACNNTNNLEYDNINLITNFQNYNSSCGNKGFTERCKWINFDADATFGGCVNNDFITTLVPGSPVIDYNTYKRNLAGASYGSLLNIINLPALWKSYVVNKVAQTYVPGNHSLQAIPGVIQYSVIATVYLKHIHSFFNMCPLLKGVFMKMTMNLNNCASTVTVGGSVNYAAGIAPGAGPPAVTNYGNFTGGYSVCNNTSSALGGVNMLMFASPKNAQGAYNLLPGSFPVPNPVVIAPGTPFSIAKQYRISLSVGSRCLDSQTTGIPNIGLVETGQCKSIYLYIPAYTFNPPFEQAYISSPVKSIKYTDIYQYQVLGVGTGQPFNNLLTNGIANIKSVLILPFYSTQNDSGPNSTSLTTVPSGIDASGGIFVGNNTGFIPGIPVWQSPFDPAGTGPTSPLCHFTNFNVQVSGQNAIYNLQLRAFEQFNNQLYGQNAVNGGLTDGITSSLVDRQQFDLEYCYYYVNVERMLPVEQSVPKSIQILGTNLSTKNLDLLCFVEYGTEVSIDVLTGSRV
jgi:hypothetical protein